MKIIAHRGFHEIYPENSFAAFDKAIEIGADAIETDILVTKDNQLVVLHDDWVSYRGESAYVNELTYDQLQEIDLGEGQRIPLLEAFYDRYYTQLPLVLDLKMVSGFPVFMEFMKTHKIDGVHLTSVLHEHILAAKESLSGITCSLNVVSVLPGTADWFHSMGLECASVFRGGLSATKLAQLSAKKIDVRVYTVNMVREAKQWADAGVEGIYTDNLSDMQVLRRRR